MYIKSIQIKNFRNFEDFSINFTNGFQTIIGENNIGKSNLYWAMRLVLDNNLSYKTRYLEEQDFYNFEELTKESYITISIELYGDNIIYIPNLHAIKTSEKTARISYVFAHKEVFNNTDEEYDKIQIEDFNWRLYGGGEDFNIDSIKYLNQITFRDIEGINIYYISGFRNINSDLFGNAKSLLSEYCKTRKNVDEETKSVKEIMETATDDLNELDFIPHIAGEINNKNTEVSGHHFTVPVNLGFISSNESEIWSELKIFFSPVENKNISLKVLGLGQKNILYLSLFLAKLENIKNQHEVNILLIEEPEAHLHPQLQKILFSNLKELNNTQVFMSSHSTHIASDCDYKNLNILYKNPLNLTKSFTPFIDKPKGKKELRDQMLLKRYIDATRSELFFASAVIFVEGAAEQFIIPAIAKNIYGINITEYNISLIPIHSRYFDPYLKLFQNNKLEITACAIIDGDSDEHEEGDVTTSVHNAKTLEVEDRVRVFDGINTLEVDLFPTKDTNTDYLKKCFENLNHEQSYTNLQKTTSDWDKELIKRIDGTIKKGRFAQELAMLIDEDFSIPLYIKNALEFIFENVVYDSE